MDLQDLSNSEKRIDFLGHSPRYNPFPPWLVNYDVTPNPEIQNPHPLILEY